MKRETSFASQCSAHEIMSKIEETAKPLGFNVRKQNYKVTTSSISLVVHLDEVCSLTGKGRLYCAEVSCFVI